MTVRNLKMIASARTHVGKVKHRNEDAVGMSDWVRAGSMNSTVSVSCLTDEPRVCLVADGLGGHAGGDVASLMVVRELLHAAPALATDDVIADALRYTNRSLYDLMASSPDLSGMGSTVVGLCAFGHRLTLFNIGDSRGYIRSGDYLQLISTDDTQSFHEIDVSERTGQRGHVISQSLGGLSLFSEVTPHLVSRDIVEGDRLLLCSDGLTDMLDQDEIERCLEADSIKSVDALVDAALAAGGEDNISVMLIDFSDIHR